MNYQLREEKLSDLLQTIRSRSLDLKFVSDFGCFNNNSQANIKRWGTRNYKAVLETFSQQVPKNICPFNYIVGERTKQLWIPPWKMMDFFITQSVFKKHSHFIHQVISKLQDKEQPVQICSSFVYQLFGFLITVVLNTSQGSNGFQIQSNRLVIQGEFETKKFRNCDREYEIHGFGPMSNKLRNFVIQLMDIDATDIDQVSSSPTIAKHLLSKLMYREMLNGEDTVVIEKGLESIDRLIERKQNGETDVKEMLNQTLYGSRRHLTEKDAQSIYDAMEYFCQKEGGFRTFRSGRSWLSHQIFNIENKLQRTFEKHLSEIGIKTLSHIYDGCIVLGHPTSEQIELAERKTVEDVGFNMKWVVKKEWSKCLV